MVLRKVTNIISHCRLILIYLYLGNYITGLDFNPNGEIVATIDSSGVCLISDVNTDSYRFHLYLNMDKNGKPSNFQFPFFLLYNEMYLHFTFIIIYHGNL